jgi:transposase
MVSGLRPRLRASVMYASTVSSVRTLGLPFAMDGGVTSGIGTSTGAVTWDRDEGIAGGIETPPGWPGWGGWIRNRYIQFSIAVRKCGRICWYFALARPWWSCRCASLPGRKSQPMAMVIDSRILQIHAGVGGRGSAMTALSGEKAPRCNAAVDTLSHLLALQVAAASEQVRAQVETLAAQVQQIAGEQVELAYVDQGYTEKTRKTPLPRHGIQLEVVKHTQAKRGFVLLPRRWVVERSFAWAAHFRRFARDYERLSETPRRLSLPRLCLPHA